jgi:hypothetical protein
MKSLITLTRRFPRKERVLFVQNFSTSPETSEPRRFPRPLRTRKHGIDVIHDPLWNKSLAFDLSERDALGLRGLLPPGVRTLDSQVSANIKRIRALPDDVSKSLYLQELHNRNETLYHRVLLDYVSSNCVAHLSAIY